MKAVDYAIIIVILGCVGLAYSAHLRMAGACLGLVAALAAWRFWDGRNVGDVIEGADAIFSNPDMPEVDTEIADHSETFD